MHKIKGFSLIELIVVITIVGLLSAIAIPVYKTYTDRAKISAGRIAIESFEPIFLKYYSSHGGFPDPQDVGLPLVTELPADISEYLVQPYVAYVGMEGNSTPGSCSYGNLTGYISNYAGDAITETNQNASTIIFLNYYIDVRGTIVKKCAYYEIANGNPTGRTDLMPGCIDYIDNAQMQDLNDFIDNACN